uniref:Uncharacterized protein n=1 Tax=Cacopsylla melanoneura TaxID=428564 RepID=A0A8D8TZP8_9HEMI
MRLCLYNGSKKKKSSSKQSKKNTTQAALSNDHHSAGNSVNNKKKCNNGNNNNTGAVRSNKTSKSNNKSDKKKKDEQGLVELALDPPELCSNLTLCQDKRGSNDSIAAQGAREFWTFVDAYTSVINKDDINLLNHLTEKYSKENCPLLNIPLSNSFPNHACSLDFPDNWVERIVGALVDPDLFPSGEETDILSAAKTSMKQQEEETGGGGEAKRMKLGASGETGNNFLLTGSVGGGCGVFSERSTNFLAGLTGSTMFVDEEEDSWMQPNCDTMSNQDEPPDEVSREILKCQEELALLCRDNEATLSRLTTLAQREFDVQHLAQNLELCESELVKLTHQKLQSSGHRLKKETATSTSSSKKSRDGEILLLQRRDFLLASIRDKED